MVRRRLRASCRGVELVAARSRAYASCHINLLIFPPHPTTSASHALSPVRVLSLSCRVFDEGKAVAATWVARQLELPIAAVKA